MSTPAMPDAVRTSPGSLPGAGNQIPRDWLLGAALAVVSALIVVVFFAPRFWLWPAVGAPLRDLVSIQPELHRAYYALQQLHDPWQRIDSDVNRVIEWRLLWPVLGHYGGMSSAVYFAMPFAGCLLALGTAGTIVWRATRDAATTLGATLLVASASWFFVSTGWLAYFDSWLVLALLLASFARQRATLFATALLAPWVDERFLLALPLCLGVRALDEEHRAQLWTDAKWLLAGVAPYLAIRVGAELLHLRRTSASYWSQHPLMPAPLDGMLLGGWHGLRLGWLPLLYAGVIAAQRKRWFTLAAVAASLVVNACIADDISRSVSVGVPAVLAGIILIARSPQLRPRIALPLLAVGNLLLPAAHLIATPLSPTERVHVIPMRTVYAEHRQAQHPPDFADPAVYTQRGIEALAANELEIASGQFDLALRFDPNFARARAHRGIVLFIRGRTTEGLAEIDRALARDPRMFDVRLQRATFRQRLGDVPGALADVREALRAMPPDWPRRQEAERFAEALGAAAPR